MFRTAVPNLGIPQANGDHEKVTRKSVTTKYLQRVSQVLKSLHRKNKVKAIDTYALPVINLAKEETEATDIKSQKLQMMHGGLHSKSATLRLHTKWKEKGRG